MKHCKECLLPKELTEFYKHPATTDGVMGRCKECVKAGRRSEKERSMARKREKENRVRPEGYVYKMTIKYREANPEKYKAHKTVSNYFRYHKEDKPTSCCYCSKTDCQIEYHHEDYSKPREIYPLCSLCHKAYHKGEIELNEEWLITF